jgi:hypothetical protein
MSEIKKQKGRPRKYLTDAEKAQAERDNTKRSNEKYYAKIKEIRDKNKLEKQEQTEIIRRSLVGWQYHNTPKEGDKVILELEPTNPYDPNAIKVITKDTNKHVGYILRGDTELVKAFMPTIKEATISSWNKANEKQYYDILFKVIKHKEDKCDKCSNNATMHYWNYGNWTRYCDKCDGNRNDTIFERFNKSMSGITGI